MYRLVLLIQLILFQLIGAEAQWIQLFNGKDLTGWEHVGPGNFIVENGLLKTSGGMGLLWYTPKKFSNCIIKVVYKTEKFQSNAGVFIRIPEKPTEPWMPVNKGFEVQIHDDDDDYHVTGTLYSFTKAKAKPSVADDWNTMEIIMDSLRTITKINGIIITDFKDGDPVPLKTQSWEPDRGPRSWEGYIGLQNHGDNDVVWFREISIKPNNKSTMD